MVYILPIGWFFIVIIWIVPIPPFFREPGPQLLIEKTTFSQLSCHMNLFAPSSNHDGSIAQLADRSAASDQAMVQSKPRWVVLLGFKVLGKKKTYYNRPKILRIRCRDVMGCQVATCFFSAKRGVSWTEKWGVFIGFGVRSFHRARGYIGLTAIISHFTTRFAP